MKELSAHDMEVWIFDTKRNPQVTRGRQEQEQAARKREEDVMDLELDFLAPYLQRFPDVSSLSKFQALGKYFSMKCSLLCKFQNIIILALYQYAFVSFYLQRSVTNV